MLVDLLNVEPNVLARYMGKENLAAFRDWHLVPPSPSRNM